MLNTESNRRPRSNSKTVFSLDEEKLVVSAVGAEQNFFLAKTG